MIVHCLSWFLFCFTVWQVGNFLFYLILCFLPDDCELFLLHFACLACLAVCVCVCVYSDGSQHTTEVAVKLKLYFLQLNHEGKCEFMIIPCPSCKEHIRFNEQERHNERECPERTLNCKYCKEPFHFKNIKVGHDLFRLARMLWGLSGLMQHIIAALYVSLKVTLFFFRHMTRSVPSTQWSVKAVRRRKYPEKRYICKQHVEKMETFCFS